MTAIAAMARASHRGHHMRTIAPLPMFLLLAACTAQTSPVGAGGATLGSGTPGNNGKLQFAYVSSQCGLGCPLDRPVVQGAMITIQATGGDPSIAYTMAVEPASLGTVTTAQTCMCSSSAGTSGSGRVVGVGEPCGSGETRSCIVSADVQTSGPGTASIEVLDPSGRVVDSAPFSIAPADRIDQSVLVDGRAAAPGADGSYAVHVGDHIEVRSTVYSGDQKMVFTQHGLEPSYSHPDVVASDPSVVLGATDVEYAVAKAPGDASVTMTAVGAKATVAFDVSP
jgi:hypothetical protein